MKIFSYSVLQWVLKIYFPTQFFAVMIAISFPMESVPAYAFLHVNNAISITGAVTHIRWCFIVS